MTFTKKEALYTKEQHVANFIKTLIAIETAMEPFKEQKKELREEYADNSWLSKEEMRMAVKAYRLMKSDTDLDELLEYFNNLKKSFKGTLQVV